MSQLPFQVRVLVERLPKLVLQIIENRFSMLSLELQEEKLRIVQLILIAIVASTLALLGIIGVSIFIVWVVPPGDRLWVALTILGVYLVGAVILAVTARTLLRKRKPFEYTIGIFKKDIES